MKKTIAPCERRRSLILLYGITALFLFSLLGSLRAQDEPETKENVMPPADSTERQLSVEQSVQRFALRLDNEVSFLLPEGEFNLAFEKRFGNFLTQTRAHYNFVRGELGFSLRNIYTRYRIVPQLQVYERLKFVPLFNAGRLWRREQGVQIGGRFFPGVPLATFTSYTYERLSFPSSVNVHRLESQTVHAVAQGFSGKVDSIAVFGLISNGIFELEIAKSLAWGSSDFDYLQLRLSANGSLDRGIFSLRGQFRLISLLEGASAPPQFLGGRNQLSGFDNNKFSGVNLFYGSLLNVFRLKKTPAPLFFKLFASEISVSTQLELGQVGSNRDLLTRRTYHASLGAGLDGIVVYRRTLAFELFIYWYHGLEAGGESRYYVGIKF
jgi:hypothetical protein